METFISESCPIYFRLLPYPAEFQPFLGFSLKVPPLITALNFSYYGSGIVNFTVAYSSICDNIITAYAYPPTVIASSPSDCRELNTTSAGTILIEIEQIPESPTPITNINLLFTRVSPNAVVYIGEISYTTEDSRVLLGPCPLISAFPLADCIRV